MSTEPPSPAAPPLALRRARNRLDPQVPFGVALPVRLGVLLLGAAEVTIEVLDRWKSTSGALYPVRWRLVSAAAELDLEVDRRLDDQELRTSFTYWEGAVSLRGTSQGCAVLGAGYVEMTGYAASMRGVL